MKRILILVTISMFSCSTASALQGGGGESTKKGSSKKKVVTRKTSGTTSAKTTPLRPPASPVPTRTPAPTPATTKAQAVDRERQYEALRIAERKRVEQRIAGEWSDGTSWLSIIKDRDKFSALYPSSKGTQVMHGELLADNQLRLTNNNVGKIVNPFEYYVGDFDKEAWIELGDDGSFLTVRFSQAKGGRSLVMKRISRNPDSQLPVAASVSSPPVAGPIIIKAGRLISNSLGVKFAYCPAGTFQMGSTKGNSNEKPIHTVSISQGFYLGTTEVTQGQWKAVMGSLPSTMSNLSNDLKGDDLPVANVFFEDVEVYIERLNGLGQGTYRLPTEAEWEYAVRAGTGDYAGNVDELAWYGANSEGHPHAVGTKKANAWGLYDMYGNVWEWVVPVNDGVYDSEQNCKSFRVNRAGRWYFIAAYCSEDLRYGGDPPGDRDFRLGFRLLRTQ